MKTLPVILVVLIAALCGCQTSPPSSARKTPARKAIPPPPIPHGLKLTNAVSRTATAAPRASFVPASVTAGPAVFINGYHVTPADPPYFPAYTNVFIVAEQLSNNVLSIRMNTVPTGDPATWAEPAQFDCYPMDNLVALSISVHDPDNHHFRSINTPCAGGPALAFRESAHLETATPTKLTMKVRGKTYKLVALKRAGEDTRRVQRYRLTK